MNTKRKHDVKVRMSDNEYEQFLARVNDAGTTQQMYGLDALLCAQITPKEEIDLLVELNQQMADLVRIQRGIGNNINQVAHRVNINHGVEAHDIEQLQIECESYGKENNRLWQLIRLLLTDRRRTAP